MTDPTSATIVPHLIGITLSANGVATSQVLATNQTRGGTILKATDANKRVIFDISQFTSGYEASDVIEFQNVGTSFGGTTVTVNSATGGLQLGTITSTAASTANLSM